MKAKCCKICIVQPICTQGCDDLWSCYKKLIAVRKRYNRYNNWIVWFMIISSISWAILIFSDTVILVDGSGQYYIKPWDVHFWHWWYTLSYMSPVITFATLEIIQKRCKKMEKMIENSERGTYIFTQIMKEASLQAEEKKMTQGTQRKIVNRLRKLV